MVVVVLGLLASIVSGKYDGVREKAYIATVISDVKTVFYAFPAGSPRACRKGGKRSEVERDSHVGRTFEESPW